MRTAHIQHGITIPPPSTPQPSRTLHIHAHVPPLHAIPVVTSSSPSADAGRKTRETRDSLVATRMASVGRAPQERGDGPRNDGSMHMEAAPDHVGAAARAEKEEAGIGITNLKDAVKTAAAVSAVAAALQDVPGKACDQAAVIFRAAVHAAADGVEDVACAGLKADCAPAGDKGSGLKDKADGGMSLVQGSSFFISMASTAAVSSVAVDGSKGKAIDGLSRSENDLGKKIKVESAEDWNEACANSPAHGTREDHEQGPHGNLDAYVAAVKAVEDMGTSSLSFEVQLQNLRGSALEHGTVPRLLMDKTLSVHRYLARTGKMYRKSVLWCCACVKAIELMEATTSARSLAQMWRRPGKTRPPRRPPRPSSALQERPARPRRGTQRLAARQTVARRQ